MDMTDFTIEKYENDPDFIEWLEEQWIKSFPEHSVRDAARKLFGDCNTAVEEYENQPGKEWKSTAPDLDRTSQSKNSGQDVSE